MASSVKRVRLFLLLVAFLNTASSISHIKVAPAEINPGLTNSLFINCSYSTGASTGMAALISVILSRSNEAFDDFEELAAVSQFSPESVNQFTNESFTAIGSINPTGESFLQVQWNYPTSLQAGMYRCLATGVDHIGHTVSSADLAQINSTVPDTESLLEKIRLLDTSLNSLNVKMTTMEASVDQKLIAMSQEINKLTQTSNQTESTDNVLQTRLDKMKKSLFLPPLAYGDSEYYVSKHSFTDMNVAMATCELFGGYLAEIDTNDEYRALTNFCDKNVFDEGVLVSGTDEAVEGKWVFQRNGLPLPVQVWIPGEPNDGRTYNCLALWRANYWQMSDHPCYNNKYYTRFVCEVPV